MTVGIVSDPLLRLDLGDLINDEGVTRGPTLFPYDVELVSAALGATTPPVGDLTVALGFFDLELQQVTALAELTLAGGTNPPVVPFVDLVAEGGGPVVAPAGIAFFVHVQEFPDSGADKAFVMLRYRQEL